MSRTALSIFYGLLMGTVISSLCLLVVGVQNASALTCEISPSEIPIDLGYHGTNLVVSGTSAPNAELIIKISAAPETSMLKYKGKTGGVFWMKKGDLEYENVPKVYLLYTSREIDRLLPPAARTRYSIGYPALQEQVEITGTDAQLDKGRWFAEFIKFKEKDNLYDVQEGAITRKRGQTGDEYRLETHWPFQAQPGNYSVEVLAVQNGKVTDTARAMLQVERAGLVEQLSQLAFNRPAVYGIMAIIIAMTAGFAVGALFKGGGAH